VRERRSIWGAAGWRSAPVTTIGHVAQTGKKKGGKGRGTAVLTEEKKGRVSGGNAGNEWAGHHGRGRVWDEVGIVGGGGKRG